MFKHLENNKETYFTHMLHSLNISFQMLKGSSFALIHAFFPDTFSNNASNICRNIIKNVDKRTTP